MSRGQAIGDGDARLQCFIEPHALRRDQRVKRLAAEVLHDQVVDPIVQANVVDRDDIWMIERRSRLRFLRETEETGGVGVEARRQHLDGDQAIQSRVAGLVDVAHSSRADFFEDLIVPERLADQNGLPSLNGIAQRPRGSEMLKR